MSGSREHPHPLTSQPLLAVPPSSSPTATAAAVVTTQSHPQYGPDHARGSGPNHFHYHDHHAFPPQDPFIPGGHPAARYPIGPVATSYALSQADPRFFSAQRHQSGVPAWRADSSEAAVKTPATPADPSSHPTWTSEAGAKRSSKRSRPESTDSGAQQDAVDDETKRTRGRPRLQTTDQTASERRRTQIRLAQRAYRSRKETAMNDLEGQVKRLKDSNTEIREAIQDLADCAGRYSHLIREMPELALHLQKLRNLAKRRKHSLQSEDSTSEDGQDNPEPIVKREDIANVPSSPIARKDNQPPHLLGGAVVTYQASLSQGQHIQSHSFDAFQDHPVSEYEVIAIPTAENASFAPNKIDLDAGFLQGIPWATQPQLSDFSPAQPGRFPVSAFGCRLHRHAKAKTAALINVTPPPTEGLLRAFGFSSLFESLEEARTRINNDNNEMMYNLQYSYYADGSTASNFQSRDQQGHPPESSSQFPSSTTYRPETTASRMPELRGKLLEICKAAQLPEPSSTIWDCDEVDLYFTQRGVALSGAVDLCNVQIHPLSFVQPNRNAQPQHGSGQVSSGHDGNSGAQFSLTQPRWNGTSASTFGGPIPPDLSSLPESELKMMRVDISKLLDNLAERTICFGRNMWFRPRDVDSAFWNAVSA
ncbi:AP-1-like transcription factor [Microdochium nivale]|nr:AP-1-like transcription factor [Microdochium nivale]